MCPNRNNPEEFVTATGLAPYPGSYSSDCRMLGPGLVGWGRWGSGPCFLRVSETAPMFICWPRPLGDWGDGVRSGPTLVGTRAAPILRSSNFKDKASPCIPLWLGELHYVLVLRLKQ